MEAPSKAKVSPEPIFEAFTWFMASKYFFIAIEVGLFEHLAGRPATLDELTTQLSIPRRTLRIVADALVALKFLERDGEQYANSPVASAYLSGTGPADFRPFVRMGNQLLFPRWQKFEETVRTDERILGELAFTEREQEIFSKGVEAGTTGDARALASKYDFAQHRRLLDLGGGTGSFLLAVLRKFPHLKTTLFELPSAAAVARERLKGESQDGNIEIVAGDLFVDPIPEGFDSVIVSHVVHCLPADSNVRLLQRLRQHVEPKARVLLIDFWTDPTHTQPRFTALMAGQFLIDNGGDVFSVEDATDWLHSTGWRVLENKHLVGPTGLIVAEAV